MPVMHSKTNAHVAADELLLQEQQAASSRWYRSGVVHPVIWLHPRLKNLPSVERDQLLAEARLHARGSWLFLVLMLLWLAVGVLVWYFAPASSRQAFGTTAIAIAALGGSIVHGICYHRAIREQLTLHQAQRSHALPSEA